MPAPEDRLPEVSRVFGGVRYYLLRIGYEAAPAYDEDLTPERALQALQRAGVRIRVSRPGQYWIAGEDYRKAYLALDVAGNAKWLRQMMVPFWERENPTKAAEIRDLMVAIHGEA